MNVVLGDLEEYVQRKLASGGYNSASEVVREALRQQRARELEEAIERRIQAYVLKGIDQGPPDGLDEAAWAVRLEAARRRMDDFIGAGLASIERGDVMDGETSRARMKAKQASRRARAESQ